MATQLLPETITAASRGHFGHHEALHKRYNETADHEPRIAALEATVATLTKGEYTIGPFQRSGDTTTAFTSQVQLPVPVAGTIVRVECRCASAPASADIECKVNGTSIFSSAHGHPRPHFTTGQNQAEGTPDPPLAHVDEDDNVAVEVATISGTMTWFTATVVVQPD